MIYVCPIRENEAGRKHEEQTEAARRLLSAALRREYGLSSLPQIAADGLGKPYFTERRDIFFNYSHCRAGILCGVGSSPIGVDIETLRNFRKGMAERICHRNERELLGERPEDQEILTKLWVAKEAYLKYTGTGIRSDLRLLDMSGICRGAVQNPDGSHMRLWERGGMYLCACTREAKQLQLQEMEI